MEEASTQVKKRREGRTRQASIGRCDTTVLLKKHPGHESTEMHVVIASEPRANCRIHVLSFDFVICLDPT